MKRLIFAYCLLIIAIAGFAQSKVNPVTRSEMAGIELPVGSKQDKRILATASAKTLLDMTAEENKINLEEDVEVFTLVGTVGSGTVEQVKLAAQQAGWQLTSLSGQTRYWVLSKNYSSLLMYLESNKRDTQLYLSRIKTGQNNTTPVISQSTPPQNKSNDQPANSVPVTTPQKESTEQRITASPASSPPSGYKFTTINFDDGWVSTVREDWVEVTKNNVRVLIHYPNPTTNEYISDPNEMKRIAWNILVAPRYSNLQNYFVAKCALSYIQGSFISGTLTDNKTGQTVYVALFKRDRSPWMEFIAPNITAFGQATGFDITTLNGYVENEAWNPLHKFEGYNKFAVAASDLTGTWTNNFSGFTQYVNAYTGADAGMNTHSSSQTFEFLANGTYNWSIGVASGFVGSIKFSNAKSSGKFTNPNNWQIHFSDLEGKPKLYNAYFSCIKGARILWLQDTGYGDYSGYGRKE
ncbi:MAG: hypothetical protein KF725_10925 [Cyclobacteriaceae bacterium]|nr:hypothetical protein [Cyclobacteriaceae bacterium]UYN86219.1 MAG: hypothetical protein KIT51_15315 [Cyclobacteriaceae bacterium]